jgi:hypothetical protein
MLEKKYEDVIKLYPPLIKLLRNGGFKAGNLMELLLGDFPNMFVSHHIPMNSHEPP